MGIITRCKIGKSFVYLNINKQITDTNTLERIRKLHIPPNWTNINISTRDTDYLQVTGNDTKGRTQYIYHPVWVELAKIEKYERMKLFTTKVEIIKKRINGILSKKMDLTSKEYIIALLFRIMLLTHSRVGNDQYAEENNTYGLTTLLKKHVKINGSNVILSFLGKKSIKQELKFIDPVSARILTELIKIPGPRLFKTKFEEHIRSLDMNNYLHEITGVEITCKDFRTYSSNNLFIKILCSKPIPITQSEIKRTINQCYDEVAEYLGHTRAVSKSSYVMPIIAENYARSPQLFVKSKPSILKILGG
jgi:DNA topoisomerase-1